MPPAVEGQHLAWRHDCERFGSFWTHCCCYLFYYQGYVGVEVTGNNAIVNVGANVKGWMDGWMEWDTQRALWYWGSSSLETNRLGLA